MAIRITSALRNYVLQNGSFKQSLQNGKIEIYTGTQPTTPETAPTGSLLCTYTEASAAHTAEVLASGTVTLTTGASGSVNTVTVNGVNVLFAAVPYNASLNQTAADVAASINEGLNDPEYTATSAAAVVTITATRGTGATPNTFVVSATLTTLTASFVNLAGGVTPVNGLRFGSAAAGSLAKRALQVWSGVAGATGTAGWFRFVGSVVDSNALDGSEAQIRLDGSISTVGADLNLSSTTITATATQTINSFTVTLPAA